MSGTPTRKVSVHIIAYNQKEFIREAIDSALAQDYPNLEVVVADDASTDGTAEIIAEYARRYPDKVIPVLNSRNIGITANSNVGLRACSGELIAFMGGDDVLLPGKIKAQVDWFAKDDLRVLCGHQVEVFYDDNRKAPHPLNNLLQSGRGASAFIRHGAFGALSTMVRADAIPPHGFDERLPRVSDQKLWIDILSNGGEYGFVVGTYARYRRHSANVTGRPIDLAAEFEQHLHLVGAQHPQYARDVRYAITHHALYYHGVQLLESGAKRQARAKFVEAMSREPWYLKAWIRFLQSFL